MHVSSRNRRLAASILLAFFCATAHAVDDAAHWWSGISISPGVGMRHLGLDVERRADGASGNLAQATAAKLFASFSVTTPEYRLGESHWGVALRMYSSFVTLDRQFYDYNTISSSTGTSQGERIDVGTSARGYYTYILPTLSYRRSGPAGEIAAAFGVGLWSARFNGDIILTTDNRPSEGMPTSDVSFSVSDKVAYLVVLSYTTRGRWLFEMTVGGTQFGDNTYRYELEEVALIVGKTFTL